MKKLTCVPKEMTQTLVPEFDATALLNAPFMVVLRNAVTLTTDESGVVVDTAIPNPDGLLKAVAQARVLHSRRLSGNDLKFLRSALGVKANYLAKRIALSPEHLSRCETGMHPLTLQSELLARIFIFVSALPFTGKRKAKGSEIGDLVAKVFERLDIKSAHAIDEELSFDFVLERRLETTGKLLAANDDEEVWDQPPLKRCVAS